MWVNTVISNENKMANSIRQQYINREASTLTFYKAASIWTFSIFLAFPHHFSKLFNFIYPRNLCWLEILLTGIPIYTGCPDFQRFQDLSRIINVWDIKKISIFPDTQTLNLFSYYAFMSLYQVELNIVKPMSIESA